MQDVKCAIYLRQSKDNAEGIDRQRERCRNLAALRGWTVVAEYEDNATSASKARKAGSAWATMLTSPADLIIAVDVDRLLRSLTDLLSLIEKGKRVVTVDGEIDLTTADGEFRATMLAAIARFEIRRKSERQKRANEFRRTKDDGALPVPGRRRFGFQSGNLIEDPVEGQQVRAAYDAVLQGASVYSVAQKLGVGIDTARGILRNPSYAGWLTRGTYVKGQRVSMEKFEAHKSVARIVDRTAWEKVQVILDGKVKTSPGNKVSHLLSGLITCTVCEGPARFNAGGYRCKAGHVYLDAEAAEREVIEELLYVLRAPEGSEPVDAPELVALNVEEAELIAQRQAAQRVGLLPGADMDHLARELVRIAKRLDEVQGQRSALRLADAKAELGAAVMNAWDHDGWEQDALDAWVAYFRALTLDQQRELVRDNLRVRLDRGRTVENLTVAPVK